MIVSNPELMELWNPVVEAGRNYHRSLREHLGRQVEGVMPHYYEFRRSCERLIPELQPEKFSRYTWDAGPPCYLVSDEKGIDRWFDPEWIAIEWWGGPTDDGARYVQKSLVPFEVQVELEMYMGYMGAMDAVGAIASAVRGWLYTMPAHAKPPQMDRIQRLIAEGRIKPCGGNSDEMLRRGHYSALRALKKLGPSAAAVCRVRGRVGWLTKRAEHYLALHEAGKNPGWMLGHAGEAVRLAIEMAELSRAN